jgi:prophage antirepressor-like protein
MQQLQKFIFQGNKGVRVLTKENAPFWVAKDVCEILELGNPSQALSRLEEDEKGLISNDTPGGQQKLAVVNEPGLYTLILGSRKPEAKEFKRWITHIVIPTIRKTGKFDAQKPMSIEDMIITQAESVKEIKQDVDQLKTVVDNEVWVNERMKKEIQDTVSRRVFKLRESDHDAHYQTIYSSLKRFFGVSKYDKIPRKDFDEAINFITGWYPPVKKQLSQTGEGR